jgi:hypothetical protein
MLYTKNELIFAFKQWVEEEREGLTQRAEYFWDEDFAESMASYFEDILK